MIKEFKDFIMKGNVLDLAVAVIIGAAFGTIVTSFTNDILMPPIGLLLGGADFSDLAITLKDGVPATATAEAIPAVQIKYGQFINVIINFLITAFAIFLVVKAYNSTQKPAEEAAPAGPSNEEVLLAEIRDLLKK
ncbi:MAG: large-conductance mechanosensitive channel protein MscL [Bacteroidota bacterium]